jgi:CHAT domain-containing protein/tetratricopeptide (TPR) repeat protein
MGRATDLQHEAIQLTQQGFAALKLGRSQQAYQDWEQARSIYTQLKDTEGISGSLINRSLAERAMGKTIPACRTLIEALTLPEWVCIVEKAENHPIAASLTNIPKPLQTVGLKNLGDILRDLGQYENAIAVLEFSLKQNQHPALLLSLANARRERYHSTLPTTKTLDNSSVLFQIVRQRQQEAATTYQAVMQLGEQTEQPTLVIDAWLNHLDCLTSYLFTDQANERSQYIQSLSKANFTHYDGIDEIDARLLFVKSLIREQNHLIEAQQQVRLALTAARNLQDQRRESFALGQLGRIEIALGQSGQAHLSKALQIAQSIQAWELMYQWQWELGRSQLKNGQSQDAALLYESAIHSLDQVRSNLLAIPVESQYTFYEAFKPLYEQYIDLLFSQPQPNLLKIMEVASRLQMAELENYLQCGRLDWLPITQIQQQPEDTLFFVVDSEKYYNVIVQRLGQQRYTYRIDRSILDEAINNFLTNLQSSYLPIVDEANLKHQSQIIYDLLIAPAQSLGVLPAQGNLVFSPNPLLQNLPIDLLYDGQHYLVEKYSTAIALGSQMRPPKFLPPEQLKILMAGVSEQAPSFGTLPALTQTIAEFNRIQQGIPATSLLNQNFTRERFEAALRQDAYPIVHLSTHGKFYSDATQTALLAWDQPLSLQRLRQILKRSNSQDASIELLVLSACETAKGDQRSILGIAGAAAQAGARSTVASLWLVDESSTVEMMGHFYDGLRQGLPKSAALRAAKLALIQDPDFAHPYYWAPFILVGGWQ